MDSSIAVRTHRLAPWALGALFSLAALPAPAVGAPTATATTADTSDAANTADTADTANAGEALDADPLDDEATTAPRASSGFKVTLDTARAATKTISPQGGSIQAAAANGTRFVLSIPAQGVDFSEAITLTPLKSARNLPLTPGLVAGVEIGPPGLRFAATVMLSIKPPQPAPLAQETTFAYRSGDSQLFLYPAGIGQRPVALAILHAGGYGVARATAAQQAAQLGRPPARPEDQFDQRLWHEHWQIRQGLTAAPDDSDTPAWLVDAAGSGGDLGFYQEDYTSSLEKTLDDIAASCDGRKKWGYYAKSFIAHATSDGLSAQLSGEIGALQYALAHGDAKCYDDATQACLEGDHTQPVPALQWWNQLLRDGATSLVDPGKLESCLVFDLEWDTLVEHSNPAPEGYLISASHRLDTHATIRFHVAAAGVPTGVAPPTLNNYVSAKWLGGAPKNCTIQATGQTRPDNFSVPSLTFDVNLFEDSPPPPTIDLVYNTGNPQMELAETCNPGGTTKSFQGLFAPAYLGLHFLEEPELTAPGGFVPNTYEPRPGTWQVKQSALFAVRPYADSLNIGKFQIVESTELFLFHKPGT